MGLKVILAEVGAREVVSLKISWGLKGFYFCNVYKQLSPQSDDLNNSQALEPLS